MPGAGSWEDEVVSKFRTTIDGVEGDAYLLKSRMQVPASICEPIPSITPEPGDICETIDDDQLFILDRYENGEWYLNKTAHFVGPVRVLARKPKGFRDSGVADALVRFVEDFNNADTAYAEEAAYERFLSAILGVPYARVDHD